LDLAPTMADIAGISKKTDWEGTSLMPILKQQQFDRADVTITTFSIGSHTVSTPHWQLISYFDGSYELYDLQNDPNQFNNIANQAENHGVINRLKKHVPIEPRWNYFIRYRDYKILVNKEGNIEVFNQMLEGRTDEDIASEVPELVQKVNTYLEINKPKQNKFSIETF